VPTAAIGKSSKKSISDLLPLRSLQSFYNNKNIKNQYSDIFFGFIKMLKMNFARANYPNMQFFGQNNHAR
jgi:hypothetical protein